MGEFLRDLNWRDERSHLLLNPLLPDAERQRLQALIEGVANLPGHVFLSTSGTVSGTTTKGGRKFVALSKSAILASANTVNEVYGIEKSDRWFLTLPIFHIGGLSIYARAFLTESLVVPFFFKEERWDPIEFVALAKTHRVSVGSLVPTQIHDLVEHRLLAPTNLRLIFVGGGALSADLYRNARKLGWPLLPTYGCSEAASQIATAPLDSLATESFPGLELLPHLQVEVSRQGHICFKGSSLFSGYLNFGENSVEVINPFREGWFTSDDLGVIVGGNLICRGRGTFFIKVNGESVDLNRLNEIFQSLSASPNAVLIGYPDERSGSVVALVVTDAVDGRVMLDRFNAQVLPFERIRKSFVVDKIPKTELGKVKHADLLDQLKC